MLERRKEGERSEIEREQKKFLRKEKDGRRRAAEVGVSERAHGLGRRCGVIQSRFRPMNFLHEGRGLATGGEFGVQSWLRSVRHVTSPLVRPAIGIVLGLLSCQ